MTDVTPDFKPEPLTKQPKGQMRRRPWPRSPIEDETLRLRFKGYVCSKGCLMWGPVSCEGPLQAHHAVSKSALKKRGYPASVIWDPANGICLCARHHERHTNATGRIPMALLPARVFKFAALHGVGHILEREYP